MYENIRVPPPPPGYYADLKHPFWHKRPLKDKGEN